MRGDDRAVLGEQGVPKETRAVVEKGGARATPAAHIEEYCDVVRMEDDPRERGNGEG